MSSYDEELLGVARRLLVRRTGQRGPLKTARIRRSVSTSYYALLHFILEEVGLKVVGTRHDLRARRRLVARTISHATVRSVLDKLVGVDPHPSIASFFTDAEGRQTATPDFVRDLAKVFADAHAKRQDADYNLDAVLSAADARLLTARVRTAIGTWRGAKTTADTDFKHAFSVLILVKGRLRADERSP